MEIRDGKKGDVPGYSNTHSPPHPQDKTLLSKHEELGTELSGPDATEVFNGTRLAPYIAPKSPS